MDRAAKAISPRKQAKLNENGNNLADENIESLFVRKDRVSGRESRLIRLSYPLGEEHAEKRYIGCTAATQCY